MNLMTKMISFGATLVALMLLLAGMAYYNMNQMGKALSEIGEINLPLSGIMHQVTEGQLRQSAWLERSLLASEIEATEEMARASDEFSKEDRKITAAIKKAIDTTNVRDISAVSESQLKKLDEFKSEITEIKGSYSDYFSTGSQLLVYLQAGDIVQAESILKKVQTKSIELTSLIDPLTAKVSKEAELSASSLVESSDTALMSMSILGLMAVFSALALSFIITRSILTQLGADPADLMRAAEHLAQGKLDPETNKSASGVAASIDETIYKLQEVIRGIQSGAEEVGLASEQVGQGNSNLSQRTQEQASSLEEIAASMEEMTSTVNQNAENANQANQLAVDANRQAEEGGSIAGEAVTAMNEINESSKRISDIIGVIDDISFQINLLALNAAVEAARAGDQGRGFAVVAGEVRNLAGRSATAAKEIKMLIQDSVEKVEGGTHLVGETGTRLTEIVSSIKMVSDNVAEIAAASREQSDGIVQVNRAILQMDEMTQQNASLVEEAAAASETVDSQAQELRSLVSFFKFKNDEAESKVAQFERPKKVVSINKLAAPAGRSLGSAATMIEPTLANNEEWEQF